MWNKLQRKKNELSYFGPQKVRRKHSKRCTDELSNFKLVLRREKINSPWENLPTNLKRWNNKNNHMHNIEKQRSFGIYPSRGQSSPKVSVDRIATTSLCWACPKGWPRHQMSLYYTQTYWGRRVLLRNECLRKTWAIVKKHQYTKFSTNKQKIRENGITHPSPQIILI